jgi:hypothetical protein
MAHVLMNIIFAIRCADLFGHDLRVRHTQQRQRLDFLNPLRRRESAISSPRRTCIQVTKDTGRAYQAKSSQQKEMWRL